MKKGESADSAPLHIWQEVRTTAVLITAAHTTAVPITARTVHTAAALIMVRTTATIPPITELRCMSQVVINQWYIIYFIFYNESDVLNTPAAPDGLVPDAQGNYAQAAPGMDAAVPNGIGTTNAQAYAASQNLVLHATTQYDANHQKVKVTDPHALGYGAEKPLIHGNSWVLGDAYCLDLDDPYCRSNHPKLKKADPSKQITTSIVVAVMLFFLALSNGIYEMLIWIFENVNMTDEAFVAVDNAIFFGQFVLPLIIVGFSLISRNSVHKMNLMFCKQMLQHYAIEDEKEHFDRTHEFLDICPQCGAARLPDARECPYCGTSLLRMIEY